MFATYAGTYSRKPLPAQPDRLGQAAQDLLEGRIDEAGHRAVADDFVREILDEMAVVGLGIVGEGGVRAVDRTLPWIESLDGLAAGEPAVLADGEHVTRPIVEGDIRWTRPVTVRDWTFAAGETELLVKQTMLGPYTLATLAEPSSTRRRAATALAFAEALGAEIQALADAGCPMVEVDEPLAAGIGADSAGWRAFRGAHERLMVGLGKPTTIHLSLGLWGGDIDPAGYETLVGLPYQSYLVDALGGPPAWRFVDTVPAERGVIVGAGDARTERIDETELLLWAMAWAAQGGRGSTRVGVAPNGTLGSIGRHFAHRKCLRLGEAVTVGSVGPLEEVATAMEDDPARSSIPELRELAAAVAEARGR
jgi:5-methyltetrahydropteroyltriglutamate--homocysteine methyltransferase